MQEGISLNGAKGEQRTMRNRYIALIPAFEPDAILLSLTAELKKKGFDIVIVDDGSGEAYAELFEEASKDAAVLTHSVNRGKGAALKTGMSYIHKYMAYTESLITAKGPVSISGRDAVIVTVDADGQHLPEDALRIARIAEQRSGALVLGSRALRENVPARSRFGNAVTRHVYSMATGVKVHDTQTGLRAFRSSMIPGLLDINGERYEYEINMLMELASEGVPIIEEEIETVYEDGSRGSHFSTIRDSYRIYKEILKFSASSLASFVIDYLLYALLLAATGTAGLANGLVISNIGARIVSASANYTMNRRMVFKSRTGFAASAVQYMVLAAFVLAGNTMMLSMLAGTFGMNRLLAKIITEITFFAISWTVQKYVIFFKEEDTEYGTSVRCSTEAGRAGRAGKEARDVQEA